MRSWYVFSILALTMWHAGQASESWETCELYTPMPGEHHGAFELGCWGDDGSHLHGLFMYAWSRYADDQAPAALHGIREGEFFRPNVTFQVGACYKGPRKTVGHIHAGDEVLAVDKEKRGSGLNVQLDIFRPYLRSGKCGRIVLESGEGAPFKLDILLPQREKEKRGN